MSRWAAAIVVLALTGAACHHTAGGRPAQPQNPHYMAGWNFARSARSDGRHTDCRTGGSIFVMQEAGAGSRADWDRAARERLDFLDGCGDAGLPPG